MNHIRLITLSLAMTAICGVTLAQPPNMPAGGPMTFADLDQDGNGSVTEKEFYDGRAKRIKERSEQGYPMRNLPNAPAFSAVDLNGDGLVSPSEFATAQANHGLPPPR